MGESNGTSGATAAPASALAPATPLLEALLGIHGATNTSWIADAASSAAERGLGALYSVLYLTDPEGHLAGQRPASSERMRALVKVHQVLDADLAAARFDPQQQPAVLAAMREGHAVSVPSLSQALPLKLDADRLSAAQRNLGVAECWLAPLLWTGESWGLLLLLMPANRPASVVESELLGRHIAVALTGLRERETGRKQGEVDLVRSVYDERRFLEELTQELRRAQRHQRPLSVMLLRIQNLEELRARYGRFLTEQVLRQVGDILADRKRETDFLGASGEDGFATILVEADQEGAGRAKERLLTSLDATKLPNADLPDMDVQFACATATLPEDGETAEDLAATATARLVRETPAQQEVA